MYPPKAAIFYGKSDLSSLELFVGFLRNPQTPPEGYANKQTTKLLALKSTILFFFCIVFSNNIHKLLSTMQLFPILQHFLKVLYTVFSIIEHSSATNLSGMKNVSLPSCVGLYLNPGPSFCQLQWDLHLHSCFATIKFPYTVLTSLWILLLKINKDYILLKKKKLHKNDLTVRPVYL